MTDLRFRLAVTAVLILAILLGSCVLFAMKLDTAATIVLASSTGFVTVFVDQLRAVIAQRKNGSIPPPESDK